MAITLSAPGKTFLLGEYLALKGGPALLVSTGPRFKMTIQEGEGQCEGIHPQSLAGLWMRARSIDFSQVNVKFHDPYEGKGGFGASSAQFLFVYFWSEYLKNKNLTLDHFCLTQLWKSYLSMISDEGISPSGLDVLAQAVGGVSFFEFNNDKLTENKKLKWAFENQSFCLLKTNNKVKTHEHLKELDLDQMDLMPLKPILSKAKEAFLDQDAFQLLVSLEKYYQFLLSQNLVHPETQEVIKQLIQSGAILGAKGCGALGADVIWVLCETDKLEDLKSLFQVVGLNLVATEENIESGLEFHGFVDFDLRVKIKSKEELPSQKQNVKFSDIDQNIQGKQNLQSLTSLPKSNEVEI